MTDVAAPEPRLPLGVGQIVTEILAVFFRRLPKIVLLTMPAGLGVAAVVYGVIVLEDQWTVVALRGSALAGVLTVLAFLSLALGVGLGLAAGPMAAAYNGYRLRGRVAVGPSLRRLRDRPLAAMLCGVIVTAATLAPLAAIAVTSTAVIGLFIAMLALSFGMYAMGRWGMALPAISREGLGMSALGRSDQLAEGYRWQIAGTCFLIWFLAFLFGGLLSAGLALGVRLFVELAMGNLLFGLVEDILLFVDGAVGVATSTAFLALGLAAIRERMLEIKEPPDIGEMIEVFD